MRADRLISLMMLLQTQGIMTAKRLAGELEVSIRTIYRDIDALSFSGIPVYAIEGPGGGYALDENYRSSFTGLNREEVQALFMLSLPGPLSELGINVKIKTAMLKLTSTLPEQTASQADHVKNRLFLDSARWFHAEDASPLLKILQAAVWNDQRLAIEYAKKGKEGRTTEVMPYALAVKAGLWYLVAETDKGMRVYRVSRILSAQTAEDKFIRKPDFNLELFWKSWVHEYQSGLPAYKVRIAADKEKLKYHSSVASGELLKALESAEPGASGETELVFTFERMEEARMHILALGDSVRVISPASLRNSIARFAAEISVLYERSTPINDEFPNS